MSNTTKLTKDSVPALFAALKDHLQNKRLMSKFSNNTNIARVNLYGLLDNKHKPSYDKFLDILEEAGYEVTITAKK